jgi:hypothetical protein
MIDIEPFPNLHIIPQTKNPTNVGLDVFIIISFFLTRSNDILF